MAGFGRRRGSTLALLALGPALADRWEPRDVYEGRQLLAVWLRCAGVSPVCLRNCSMK